jgi:tripartite-type tricarboxylate transporter receptor subunit TctC
MPNVPTLQETGVPELKDFTYNTWVGFIIPSGVPTDIVDKLRKSLIEALNTPKVQESFRQSGFQVVGSTQQEFNAQLEQELNYNKKLVDSGIVKVE